MYYMRLTWKKKYSKPNYYALWKVDSKIENCWLLSSTDYPNGRPNERISFDSINWREHPHKAKYEFLTKKQAFLELL